MFEPEFLWMSSGFWTWHVLLPRSQMVFTPFSLDSWSSCGSPLRGCFPPSPHTQGPVSSYGLCQHRVPEHSSEVARARACACVCVCACDRLSWWVCSGGERGWALLWQPCVYTRWYLSNERTEWTDFKGSSLFPHHPFQLSVQRSAVFKGSWGWSGHEAAWNIFEAMQSDFNSFKVWPVGKFWAGRGKQCWLISQCPLTRSMPTSMFWRTVYIWWLHLFWPFSWQS